MLTVDLNLVWGESPIGITIYEPIFDGDNVIESMKLVWVNKAVSSRAKLKPEDIIGWTIEQVVGPENWATMRHRYVQMMIDKLPITYARTYNQPAIAGEFSYVATAWLAGPYIAVQVREASNDPLVYKDRADVDAALKLLDARSASTLELAQLLVGQKAHND